jgi:hypothetical protein
MPNLTLLVAAASPHDFLGGPIRVLRDFFKVVLHFFDAVLVVDPGAAVLVR